MNSQLLIVMTLDRTEPITVTHASRIESELLAARHDNGQKVRAVTLLAQTAGEVSPFITYRLTEQVTTFVLAGTTHRVQSLASRLVRTEYGPGTRITLATGDVLLMKSCTTVQQPTLATSGLQDAVSEQDQIAQMTDLTIKLLALSAQGENW
jgi:hypothetical protein